MGDSAHEACCLFSMLDFDWLMDFGGLKTWLSGSSLVSIFGSVAEDVAFGVFDVFEVFCFI